MSIVDSTVYPLVTKVEKNRTLLCLRIPVKISIHANESVLSYCSVQTVGLGGLEHNAVMVGWPSNWNRSADQSSWKMFIGE